MSPDAEALHALRRNVLWERKFIKQKFLGRLFGKMALKGFIKDEKPLKRNVPSLPEFRVKEASGDVAAQKENGSHYDRKNTQHFSKSYSLHAFFAKNDTKNN